MLTTEFKQQIVKAIAENLQQYPSANKQAVALEISAAQLSRINKGELDKVLSDDKWITIARKLGVQAKESHKWKVAKTDTYIYITTQLAHCQNSNVSGILCDEAGIGKTYSAKDYVKKNKHAIYIDCSQVKSKQKLVRRIALEFGVAHTGKYNDVYADLCYYLGTITNPLVVLDEAGDLDYSAFLELKALWNATEGTCAWYMLGADGLRQKMENNRGRSKVGYAEIFSRFGSQYQRVSPQGKDASETFSKTQFVLVQQENIPGTNTQQLYALTGGSLRKLYNESKKLR